MCSKSSSGLQPVTVPGLGQPVAGQDPLERQLLAHPADQLDGDVGGPGHADPQAGDVAGRPIRVVEQRRVDRRRAGQHGDPLALDHLQHDARVEHREREDRRAAHQAGEAPGLVPEDVEERVGDQVPIARSQVGPVAPVEVRAQRLAVGHHHTLRRPRGPRREHDVARIVRGQRADAGVEHLGRDRVTVARGSPATRPRRRPAPPRAGPCGRASGAPHLRRRAGPGSRCRGSPAR